MTSDEQFVELIGQTLAPRLFDLFGTPPEEMGFPIGDSKEHLNELLEKQFNPVEYWTEEGRKIGRSVLNILQAGGVDIQGSDIDAMLKAAMKERPDVPAATPV